MWRTCAASWRWVHAELSCYWVYKCHIWFGLICSHFVCSTFGMWLIEFNQPGFQILELDKCNWDYYVFTVFQTSDEAGTFCGCFSFFSLFGSFLDFLLLSWCISARLASTNYPLADRCFTAERPMIQTPNEVVYKAIGVFTVQWKFTAGDYELQTVQTQTQAGVLMPEKSFMISVAGLHRPEA